MNHEKANAIKDALQKGSVTLSVGRWMSSLDSDSIFTIYHMTSGDSVLINYADIAAAKKKEQQGAIPVLIAVSFIVIAVIFFWFTKLRQR